MDNLWILFFELLLFALLGLLYYLYQRKKILQYEANKGPIIMGMILQTCVMEKEENPHLKLDPLIEALDDYLHNKIQYPPIALLKTFSISPEYSEELRSVLVEGLNEWEKQ